jgi:hypothetical protein
MDAFLQQVKTPPLQAQQIDEALLDALEAEFEPFCDVVVKEWVGEVVETEDDEEEDDDPTRTPTPTPTRTPTPTPTPVPTQRPSLGGPIGSLFDAAGRSASSDPTPRPTVVRDQQPATTAPSTTTSPAIVRPPSTEDGALR